MNRIIFILLVGLLSCQNQQEKDTLFSKKQFDGKSLNELRVARNEIFARNGYVFKSNELTAHFMQFGWYEPKYKNVDSLLTETDKKNIQLILTLEKELKNCVIPVNKHLIGSYKSIEQNSEKGTKVFTAKLLKTIQQFKNRKADTTIFTIKDIDGKNGVDTLFTNISCCYGNVVVESFWTKDGKILWTETLNNPYLWISEDKEYQYDIRNQWVTFTIGVYHATPELKPMDYYSSINYETAIKMAKNWFGNRDDFDESEYLEYLKNYKGQIILSGQPEIAHELQIWYEPLQTFIKYYAP